MTNKQRRILEDAEISSELMHEVDHYLKDVGAVLSGTIHEKENYLTMLCNDIAEFVLYKSFVHFRTSSQKFSNAGKALFYGRSRLFSYQA